MINGGAGIVYDETVINAILQEQSTYSYLFQSAATLNFGLPGTATHSPAYYSLLQNPRFTTLATTAPQLVHPANGSADHQALLSVHRPFRSKLRDCGWTLRPGKWWSLQYLR